MSFPSPDNAPRPGIGPPWRPDALSSFVYPEAAKQSWYHPVRYWLAEEYLCIRGDLDQNRTREIQGRGVWRLEI